MTLEQDLKALFSQARIKRTLQHAIHAHKHHGEPPLYETRFLIVASSQGAYTGDITHTTSQDHALHQYGTQESTKAEFLYWDDIAHEECEDLTANLTIAPNDTLTAVVLRHDPHFPQAFVKPSTKHHPTSKDFLLLNYLTDIKRFPTMALMYLHRDAHVLAVKQNARHMSHTELASKMGFYETEPVNYNTLRGYMDLQGEHLILDTDLVKPLREE